MLNRRVDEDERAILRRLVALGAATPLVGLRDGNDDEDDSLGSGDARNVVVGCIAPASDTHLSKARDDPQLGIGETQYHFRDLVDDDTLEVSRDGGYKRSFPTGRFSEFE